MALVNAYCTTAEVRDHFKDEGARLNEALLERAINSASRAIDTYCDRGTSGIRGGFWQDTDVATRTFIVDHPLEAYVDDISTRTGVVVKTGTDGITFGTTLTENVDFILEPRNADKYATDDFAAYAFWKIRLIAGRSFTVAPDRPTLEVTARYGWSGVPDEVFGACVQLAARIYKMKDAPFGFAGVSEFGPVRIARANADILSQLAAYKKVFA